MFNSVKTSVKTFEKYSSEAKTELEELSKVNIVAHTGRITEQKIYISISKPEELEVIVYDLSNFSRNTYSDFNKKIKDLLKIYG